MKPCVHSHIYVTFAFSLTNTDGRNAAVDPRWGRVIHQTLPFLALLAPPIQEKSGNQTTSIHGMDKRSSNSELKPHAFVYYVKE